MTENPVCIYCQVNDPNDFNEEHIVPRAFGRFRDDTGAEVVLVGKVCASCNNSFSSFERRHAQMSLDAHHRIKSGVKGRRPKKAKPNPYLETGERLRPITINAIHPSGRQVLMRLDPEKGPVELTSVQFSHPKSQKLIAIDLTPDLNKDLLIKKLNEAGYENGTELAIYCQPEEEKWVEKLFEKEKRKLDEPPVPYSSRARVEGGYRLEDFRSLVKIAFNYCLKFNSLGLLGSEDCFKEVRDFIRFGTGDIANFCAIAKPAIVEVEMGHVIKFLPSQEEGLIVYIQLFASQSMPTPLHRIRLGTLPSSVASPCKKVAHLFKVANGKSDDGVIVPLTTDMK